MALPPRSLPQLISSGDYQRSWLRTDLLAGITVAAMLVPQAMAYAELGGLPPDAGFRAALLALPVYALLGTSRHLGVGPEPGTAVLAALAVAPLAAGDPDRYLHLMAALAFLVGIIALIGGVLRLGFVAQLLSKPVLVGYITGVGLTLLSSQLKTFTGVTIDADSFFPRFGQFFTGLGDLDGPTLTVGLGCLGIILGLRRYQPALPGALIALAASIAVVTMLNLEVVRVGEITADLPSFAVPSVSLSDLRSLLPSAAGLVLIGYTDNILTARSIAASRGYGIDPNRELVALGAMNAVAGLGGGFPLSSSASRTMVPASIGSRSQASSIVTVVVVVGFLLVGQDLLAEIPRASLAAVVVAAAFAVIDIDGFRRLWTVNRVEAGLAALTCLAIITTDLLLGVLVAVVLSSLVTFQRIARPHDSILGQGAGLDGWIDIDDDRAETLPGLLVYRFDAPLFFANSQYYCDRLHQRLKQNPGNEAAVVLDFEGIGSLDASAAEALIDLYEELAELGLSVAIARPNRAVKDVMTRSGFTNLVDDALIFPTINAAVANYQETAEPNDTPT